MSFCAIQVGKWCTRVFTTNQSKNLNVCATNLTNLRSCYMKCYVFKSGDFLIQLLRSCSNTLNKLVIEDKSRDTFIGQTELISTFKSCSQLVYLKAVLNYDKDLNKI